MISCFSAGTQPSCCFRNTLLLLTSLASPPSKVPYRLTAKWAKGKGGNHNGGGGAKDTMVL